MEASYLAFDDKQCDERIREILNSSSKYEEVDEIPARNLLTFTNGFYVNCSALFIDIRGSSSLSETHTRPVLGKLYRSYISEAVAVMNGNDNCSEIFINGDCVSGIFSTPYKEDIDSVFGDAARLNSLINLLNFRLGQKGYSPIKCGIGMAYGRALMVKAGHKGSGVSDVVWMGDVVNEASNLCHEGNRGSREPVQVSTVFYDNLKDENKKLLRPIREFQSGGAVQYEGNIINIAMGDHLNMLKAP